MRWRQTIGFLVLVASICVVVYGSIPNGVVYYAGPEWPTRAVIDSTAMRNGYGIVQLSMAEQVLHFDSLNASFEFYSYNSLSDNSVGSLGDELLVEYAGDLGFTYEDCYLHYQDSTVIRMKDGSHYDTLFLSAGSRVPVYLPSNTRHALCFDNDSVITLHAKSVRGTTYGSVFPGTERYPDGIFGDNCAWQLYNFGTRLYGGHIEEDPAHNLIGSLAFNEDYWWPNLYIFLHALMDTCSDAGKKLAINVANTWHWQYRAGADGGPANYLFTEFCFSPTRDWTPPLDSVYARNYKSSLNNVDFWYAATPATSRPPYEGTYTLAEAKMSNMAYYLATATPGSIWENFGTASPYRTDWEDENWCYAFRLVEDKIGTAKAAPYVYAQGIDPRGYAYKVYGRTYTNGLTLVRPRGNWNEHIDDSTAVSVALPDFGYTMVQCGGYVPITLGTVASTDTAGVELGEATTGGEVMIRNGSGYVFVKLTTSELATRKALVED